MLRLTCNVCGENKEVSEFYKRKQLLRGYSGYCKACSKDPVKKREMTVRQLGLEVVEKIGGLLEKGLKECPDCKEIKSVDKFYKDSRTLTGLMSYCKLCHKAQMYGDYIRHKKDKCEVCGFVPLHASQLDVDHIDDNHKNGSRKNLMTLCANCHRLKTNDKETWIIFKEKCLKDKVT